MMGSNYSLRAIAKIKFLILCAILFPWLFPVGARAQTQNDIESLKKQVYALQESQAELRADLRVIRELLAVGHQGSLPANVSLDLTGSPSRGEQSAKIVIVEFFDYQCSFCKIHFNETLPKLYVEYIRAGKVKYVLHDFPLDEIHPYALKAAEAARCAGDQDKLWLMHDQLMASSVFPDRQQLSVFAQNLGLDTQSFNKCLDTNKYSAKVRDEIVEGEKAGINGTPTFFVGLVDNDGHSLKSAQRFDGLVPFAILKRSIDDLLAQIK